MSEITIRSVSTDGTRVTAPVDVTPDLRRFFSNEEFFVEYDVDVSSVPDGILSIPVLAQACPVAWAVGADVRVPTVDRRFLHSLRTVGSVLHEMYPSFMQGGTVIAGEATEAPARDDSPADAGMLFTGGVDSLATYIRHRTEDPTLITVQGWVIGVDEEDRWAQTEARIRSYGQQFGADTTFIRSNMLSFLETPMLSAHFSDKHDGGWYSAVGGGLGMLGLCAPLSVVEGFGTVYIAASQWEDYPVPEVVSHWDGRGIPWGSHPGIDNNVGWGATSASHDGFELTRQGRVEVIADYIEDGHSDLQVRSCADSPTAGNCSRCEKCCRTAFGLAIRGLDPNRHGFDIDADFFEYARDQFEAGAWLPNEHDSVNWLDIRAHMDPDQTYRIDGADDFATWALDADFDAMTGSPQRDRFVRTLARHTPYPVYSRLYPAYDSVKQRVSGT